VAGLVVSGMCELRGVLVHFAQSAAFKGHEELRGRQGISLALVREELSSSAADRLGPMPP
jgi:hypothetical protein